jgi:hypothetical protein
LSKIKTIDELIKEIDTKVDDKIERKFEKGLSEKMKKIYVDRHLITENNNSEGRKYKPVITVEHPDGSKIHCYGVKIHGESEVVYQEIPIPGQYTTHVWLQTNAEITIKEDIDGSPLE